METELAVALIGTTGIVVVAAITTFGTLIIPKLKRIDKNAKEANAQVSNSHFYLDNDGQPILDRMNNPIPINLRDDQDQKHEENKQEMHDFKMEVRGAINALTTTMNNAFQMAGIIAQNHEERLIHTTESFDEIYKTGPVPGKGKHRVG